MHNEAAVVSICLVVVFQSWQSDNKQHTGSFRWGCTSSVWWASQAEPHAGTFDGIFTFLGCLSVAFPVTKTKPPQPSYLHTFLTSDHPVVGALGLHVQTQPHIVLYKAFPGKGLSWHSQGWLPASTSQRQMSVIRLCCTFHKGQSHPFVLLCCNKELGWVWDQGAYSGSLHPLINWCLLPTVTVLTCGLDVSITREP